jgi:hypothetical protein
MTIYRINLPAGAEFLGRDYVAVESESLAQAQLAVVKATGVPVWKQLDTFESGYIAADGYWHSIPMDAEEIFPTWVPTGATWED